MVLGQLHKRGAIYVRLGEETSARLTAENDEHHRRHRR
uniref:Uncharacterized protein n=1 Tax=Nonomuraea gerenzanensis TaxID=93944 RepID=A0A1M4ECX3_9ACTN|nr:hypothetical protein BN4615_P6034 [Nonomuraea gerenzanensis]